MGLNSLNRSQNRFSTTYDHLYSINLDPADYLYFFNFLLLRHFFLKNVMKKSQILLYRTQNCLLNYEPQNVYISWISQKNLSKLKFVNFYFKYCLFFLGQKKPNYPPTRFLEIWLSTLNSLLIATQIYLLPQWLALWMPSILPQSICFSYPSCQNFNFELIIYWQFSPTTSNNISINPPLYHKSSLNCQFGFIDISCSFNFISGFRFSHGQLHVVYSCLPCGTNIASTFMFSASHLFPAVKKN